LSSRAHPLQSAYGELTLAEVWLMSGGHIEKALLKWQGLFQ
jgi:hypothetical protein